MISLALPFPLSVGEVVPLICLDLSDDPEVDWDIVGGSA